MNTFSTQALAVILASIAVVATGCGAVKSGFNTDPLAGKARYKAMQKEGVPQPGNQVGLPNPNPVVDADGNPVPGELPPGDANMPAGQVATTVPAGEAAQVPTAAAVINKITLQAVPMPETQVLNFVEGQAAIYQITVVDSKGEAKASGLPKGASFKKVSGDVYEIKWIPAAGASSSIGFDLKTLKISVGTKRVHNLIVNTMDKDGGPMIEKITFNASSINPGEAVTLQVVFKDSGPQDIKPSVALLENSDNDADDIKNALATAKATEPVATENGRLRADIVLDTKSVKFTGKETKIEFAVFALRGENASSVGIPQVLKLNQVAKTSTTKAATSTKKATGGKK